MHISNRLISGRPPAPPARSPANSVRGIAFTCVSTGVLLVALPSISCAQALDQRADAGRRPSVATDMQLPRIDVREHAQPDRSSISEEQAFAAGLTSANGAGILKNTPGAAVWGGGGVSGLPAINGFGADRVQISINGMLFGIFCPNEMNPPLSFVNPAMVSGAQVYYGTAPVSLGGDYIGARVDVTAGEPQFATEPGVRFFGRISGVYRSNGDGRGVDADVTAATTDTSVRYTGGWSRARDYRDGDGRRIKSTLYEAQNHSLSVSKRIDNHLLTFQLGGQYIPGQAYPNQYMDMVSNRGVYGNARYAGVFDWGSLDVRGFVNNVRHTMGFIRPDKSGAMPMDTRSTDAGYTVKATWSLSETDTLRFGSELHHNRLDDWWNPVAGSMMMGPDVFTTINNGHRTRLGAFAEWERRFDARWSAVVGLRNDTVWMNTGPVQGYNSMIYGADAGRFNSRDHARVDVNLDGSAALRFQPDAASTYELAFARKTRSPNLYERYAWSTTPMAMRMIGWFGDGNGYVGNLDLKPETAHTVSVTAQWRDPAAGRWELRVSPYYSYVTDYIDVDRCAIGKCLSMAPGNLTARNRFVYLQFANHDARMYGVNVDGKATLWDDGRYGKGVLRGQLNAVRGERTDGVNLYQIMPVNGLLALDHSLGAWTTSLEMQLAGARNFVSQARNEVKTSAYALFNIRLGYQWEMLRLDLAVENIFDARYDKPLGGANLVNFRSAGPMKSSPAWGYPVAGMGRTFSARLSVMF